MNSDECSIVQRLIVEFDGTRVLYGHMESLLIDPKGQDLLACIIRSHAVVANELAERMDRVGGLKAYRADGLQAVARANVGRLMAKVSWNPELASLRRIATGEMRMARHFRQALVRVPSLHESLYLELYQMERMQGLIKLLIRQMTVMPSLVMSRRSKIVIAMSEQNASELEAAGVQASSANASAETQRLMERVQRQ